MSTSTVEAEPTDVAAVRMRRAAAHMREHHGTGSPRQLFYAEVAHLLDWAAMEGPLGKNWQSAASIARGYCQAEGLAA